MKRVRLFALNLTVLAVSVLVVELGMRLATTRDGHVEYLLGKKWYYLVPFDRPSAFPDAPPEDGVYRRYDPYLGWTIGEAGQDPPLYFSDRNGFRCSQDQFARRVGSEQETRRQREADILAIGDSFTHGDEVLFEEAWPYLLQQKTAWTVVNLGVGGYGIDQATLRYEQTPLQSRVVLLGLIAGDLERSLTQIYNFTRAGLKTKPVFSFAEGDVRVLNQPALYGDALKREFVRGEDSPFLRQDLTYGSPLFFKRERLDRSYVYRILKSFFVWRAVRKPPVYLTEDERLAYCLKILSYLDAMVTRRGGRLIVVLLGNNNTFADRLRGGKQQPWRLLEEKLEARSIAFINTADSLFIYYERDRDRVINSFGVHYTPFANEKVADLIGRSRVLAEALDGQHMEASAKR